MSLPYYFEAYDLAMHWSSDQEMLKSLSKEIDDILLGIDSSEILGIVVNQELHGDSRLKCIAKCIGLNMEEEKLVILKRIISTLTIKEKANLLELYMEMDYPSKSLMTMTTLLLGMA